LSDFADRRGAFVRSVPGAWIFILLGSFELG